MKPFSSVVLVEVGAGPVVDDRVGAKQLIMPVCEPTDLAVWLKPKKPFSELSDSKTRPPAVKRQARQ